MTTPGRGEVGPNGERGPVIKKLARPSVREAVDWELQNHIEERVERLIAEGMGEAEARKEAVRRMGDLERYRAELMAEGTAETGRRWIMGGFETLLQDIRYAFRGIRRNPGFATTLILTLALGIGATGAIFSVIDAAMLRPLPYAQPDRLVNVNLRVSPENTIPEMMASQVQPWRDGADFLGEVALHGRRAMVGTGSGEPEQIAAVVASHDLDDVLGVGVRLGRAFGPDDSVPGTRTVILSYAYWRARGGDRDIVGTEIELDGNAWTVIGVLARGLKFPVAGTSELWIPLASDLTADGRAFTQLGVVGRLNEGVTQEMAQARADVLGEALAEAQPISVGWQTHLALVGEWRANPDTRRGLWMVSGAVGLMLLIAVFNGTNLLLVRAQARRGEIGIRKALGASRLRVIRQVLAESVLLALAGGLVATLVAWASVEGISRIAPLELTFGMAHDFGIEGRALSVVFAVAAATGLFVGLIPAIGLAKSREQGAGGASDRARGRGAHRLRGVIVGAEVATSVVLLVGAGLFLRSFQTMMKVDLGMDTERLAFAAVQLPARYDGPARGQYVRDVLERLSGIPGVERAMAAQGLPPDGGGLTFGTGFQGEGEEPIAQHMLVPFGSVPEGYLATLGATLISGRELTEADRDSDGVVIDADLARQLFGRTDVEGRRMRLGEDRDWLHIVGVVEELRFGGVDDNMGDGVILYPMNPQEPFNYLDFAVRTGGDPAALLQEMRQAFRAVDDRLPLLTLETAESVLGEAVIRPRFLVMLMSVLAGVALLLAGVGIYGVLSYVVRQGRREIGIRIALGAPLAHVRRGVVAWGMAVGLIGISIGLGVAFILDDFAEALLFGVEPGDLMTRFIVAGTMMLVIMAACWIPAHRATRVDPVEVLKAE